MTTVKRTVQFWNCFGIPLNIFLLLIYEYTRLQAGCPANRSISWEGRRILCSSEPQHWLCGLPPTNLLLTGPTEDSLAEDEASWDLKLALITLSAEVRNEMSNTSSPQYALMASTGITFPLFTETGDLSHYIRFTEHCERTDS